LEVRLDRRREAEAEAAIDSARHDLGVELGRELEHGPRARPLAGLEQRVPLALAVLLGQQDLGAATAAFRTGRRATAREEPRRQHARVVDDEEIAGPQDRRQVAHAAVALLAWGVEHQQSALAARQRLLRDELVGQLEVEV